VEDFRVDVLDYEENVKRVEQENRRVCTQKKSKMP
jgi:hypothetical protein